MDKREKYYKKIAKSKAKEYLRKKKTYRTKEEKKAFKIAENFRINQWKKSLSLMESAEARMQSMAFKVYKSRINLVRNLILSAAVIIVLIVLLIVLL